MVIKKLFISILILISLTSCVRYIGYGVVMLPGDQKDIKHGDLINIAKESRIRETWVYNTKEEDHIEIKKWRVDFYETKEEASKFVEQLEKYKNYYAVITRNGHNMRSNPHANANLVYKLRKDQKIKIIGRTDTKEKIGKNFNGYWYQLITDDGLKGWSYDSYLTIYNGEEVIHSNESVGGPEIHDFFKHNWRPSYFQYMVDSKNIDLDIFKLKFKLIPDLDNKKITISVPDHYFTATFTEAKKIGAYSYQLEGGGVFLDFSRKGSVFVNYSINLKSYSKEFITMPDNRVESIISTERSKRNLKYNELIAMGPKYTSRAYGKIEFKTDNGFSWYKKNNLIRKQLLTTNVKTSGEVTFKVFINDSLKTKYDGAITFNFGDRQVLTFLYTLDSNNLKLLYVPSTKIENDTINTDDFYSPMWLSFTGQ